jgi:cation transport ATPase
MAIRYTASLINASGSGLSKIFTALNSRQGMTLLKVEDFTCYEGGVGATIRGERVLTGNAAFMNLMGIRIPSGYNLKNNAFTAVNKTLVAVFTLDYVPVRAVQNALVNLLRYRVKLFFAVRDFGIMPVMLEQKYKISVDDVEYITIQSSYDLSDEKRQEAKRVSAVLSREGLSPFAEAVTGARRLRFTALAATVFSIVSAVLGILLMFVISWSGSVAAMSAGKLLLYAFSMFIATLLVSGFAKYRH